MRVSSLFSFLLLSAYHSIHLKAAKLRLEAFAEEKSRLERYINPSDDNKVIMVHLKSLDTEINKTKNLIVKWRTKQTELTNQRKAEQQKPSCL